MSSRRGNNSVAIETIWRWLQRQPKPFLSGLLISVYLVAGVALELLANYYRSSFEVQPWDPASGLHVVLLLAFGLRYTPAILFVPAFDNAISGDGTINSILFAIASGIYVCLGYGTAAALLLGKLDIDPCLRHLRDVIWFTVVFTIASLIIACAYTINIGLIEQFSWSEWFGKWMHEWAGEATGIMMLAPPLLILCRHLPRSGKHLTLRDSAPRLNCPLVANQEIFEWFILTALTVFFTWMAFGGVKSESIEYSYLSFIPVIWIAARYGLEKTTIFILMVNICGISFVRAPQRTDAFALQFGLMTVTFTGVLLGAYVKDRLGEIDRRQKLETKLRYDATHDDLTGLRNRTWLWQRLDEAVSRAKENENYRFALLILDLDRFKNVNDSLGHLIGDRLLIAVGERIKRCVPDEDSVSRFGGDEFVILLDRFSINEVRQTARELCQTLSCEYNLDGYEIFTTISIGIAWSSLGYESSEDMLRDADIALYEAKARGKDQFVIFDRQMYRSVARRSQLENDLRRAIRNFADE